MSSTIPKQYLKIGDKTIIEHSLAALLGLKIIEKVVVAISADDEYWSSLPFVEDSKVIKVLGGASRAKSVLNSLEELAKFANEEDWVMVHDAARPGLTPELVNALINRVLEREVGGVLAMPCHDTVKKAKADLMVESTLDRDQLWLAQTPQMFRLGFLKEAIRSGLDNGLPITDEASAMELAGHPVQLLEGDENNFKVTTAKDFKMMEFLLKSDPIIFGGKSNA